MALRQRPSRSVPIVLYDTSLLCWLIQEKKPLFSKPCSSFAIPGSLGRIIGLQMQYSQRQLYQLTSSTCRRMGIFIRTIYSINSCSPAMESTRRKVCPLDKSISDLDIADVSRSALKSEALAWRFTGDPTDVQNTFDRIDMLYKFHGRASGTSYCQNLLIETDMVSSNQGLSPPMNILLDLTLHEGPNCVLSCKCSSRWSCFIFN